MMNMRFKEESDGFSEAVRSRVNSYLQNNRYSRFANPFFYFKAILLIGTYLGCYTLVLFAPNGIVAFWSMILMGPLAILIGINVAHDAAHGTISSRLWVNKLFVLCFDLLGANSYIWKKRHVHSHHSYPNVLNMDADLKQNPLIRVFPNDKVLKMHKYQFIYAPFLYLLYTLNWLHFRDYSDFFKEKIGSLRFKKHELSEIMKLLVFKSFYLTYILILPLTLSAMHWWMVAIAFFLMNFAASLLMTLALIPSHVAEYSEFPLPDETGTLPLSWSHHQVSTVIDFATNNVFLNFFFGGFNHHIAHHLFPEINHVHSPEITPIIKETIEEFGLKYNYEASFINAYLSHFRLLKNNGVQPKTSVV